MGIVAKTSGDTDFELPPTGFHEASCIWVIDLGRQTTPWGPKHQIFINWELPRQVIEFEKDGQVVRAPMTIGQFYTLSLFKKAPLRKDLEGWRGQPFTEKELQGFDVTKVLGKACSILVEHETKKNGDEKAVVRAVSKFNGKELPRLHHELIVVDDQHPDTSKLPEWFQEKIATQVRDEPNGKPPVDEPEFAGGGGGVAPDDDVPF